MNDKNELTTKSPVEIEGISTPEADDESGEPVEPQENSEGPEDNTVDEEAFEDSEKGGNEDRTMNQSTVINVAGSANISDNIYQQDHQERNNKVKFFDPTISSDFNNVAKDYDIDEGFAAARKKFGREAFVLISCDDHSIGMSAAKQLNQDYKNNDGRNVRKFSKQSIKKTESINNSVNIVEFEDGFSLPFLQDRLCNIPENTTIVIDLTSEYSIDDAKFFLSHLIDPNAQDGYFKDLKNQLKDNSLRIICLAPEKIMETEVGQYRFHIWEINPIKILIYHHFPSEAEKLYKTISKQIELEKWGPNPLGYVRNEIRKGNTFLRLVEEYGEQNSTNEEENDLQHFLSLLQSNTPYAAITEAVLFTSLYFPKLSEPLFQNVLSILLGETLVSEFVKEGDLTVRQGQKTSNAEDKMQDEKNINVTVKINDADITVHAAGNNMQRENQVGPHEDSSVAHEGQYTDPWFADQNQFSLGKETKLEALWKNRVARQKISNIAKIYSIKEPNGRSYILFQKPHLSKSASEALRTTDPFYFDKYFTRVLESSLVFHRSKFIADSALELIRQGMLLNPDLYDYQWLSTWVGKALIMIQLAQDIPPENFEQLDGQLQILASEPLLMERWTKLLRMMLGDERLSDVTNGFLSNLFHIRQYERIFQFSIRLKDTPGFNLLYWLKRLISESDEEARERSFYYLLNYYRKNTHKNPELLSKLLEWIPSDKINDHLPPLQQAALFLPILLVVGAICEYDTKAKASRNIIFPIAPGKETAQLSPVFDDLMKLLFHPNQGFDRAITKDLLQQVGKKLLKEIRIPVQGIKNGKAKRQMKLLADQILLLPSARARLFDTLLSLILIAWASRLLADFKGRGGYRNGEEILDRITGVVTDQLPNSRLKNIRNFFRESRQSVSNNKSKVDTKEAHLIMSRYIRMSRCAANSIYKNLKKNNL